MDLPPPPLPLASDKIVAKEDWLGRPVAYKVASSTLGRDSRNALVAYNRSM
jgi:hypothetical protein